MRPPSRIDRRTFLVTAAGAVVWTACSDDGAAQTPVDGGTGATTGEGPFLRLGFSDGIRTPSTFVGGIEQRFPLSLAGADGFTLMDAPASIDIVVRRLSEPADDVGVFQVRRHDDGILTPIYPLRFTPEVAGTYELTLVGDEPRQVVVADAVHLAEDGGVPLVQPGDPMRPVDTPTFADGRGVTPICTRRPDPCPFHEVTLTDALASGGPVVLLVSTPAFCQTAICGPVLDLLVDAAGSVPDAAIVHAEVYVDPENAQATGTFGDPTEVVGTYGLTFEPMLAVAGDDGVVRARLDYAWDRSELAAAFDLIR